MPGARQINDPCTACKTGTLRPDYEDVVVGESTRGIVGMPISESQIHALACNACGLLYKAADRGKSLKHLIEERSEDFKNPKKEPKACTKCRGKKLLRVRQMDKAARAFLPSGSPTGPYMETIVACENCFTVLYIHPSEDAVERKQEMEKLKVKMEGHGAFQNVQTLGKKKRQRSKKRATWGPSRIVPGSRERRRKLGY